MSYKQYCLALAVMAALLPSWGCGKKKVPDPQLTEARLVLGILDELQANRHEAACSKIDRLIVLDRANTFLYKLKASELNNVYLETVHELLEGNKVAEAIEVIKKAELNYGRNPQMTRTLEDLLFIQRIDELIGRILKPGNGTELERDCMALRVLIKDYAPAEPYQPMIWEKLEVARAMQRMEEARAIFGLRSDLAATAARGDSQVSDTMAAQFEAINPDADERAGLDWLTRHSSPSAADASKR